MSNVDQPTLIDGEELQRLLAGVGVVGDIDGYPVIRRSSVLELVNRRISDARAAGVRGPVAAPLFDANQHFLPEVRQALGEALTERLLGMAEQPDWNDSHEIDLVVDCVQGALGKAADTDGVGGNDV